MSASVDPERWRRLSALFDHAIELPPESRARWLQEVCADDRDLRADLERMLAADASTNAFDQGIADILSRDVGKFDLGKSLADDEEGVLGDHAGPWLLERVLGRGGMGTVYAARRDDGDTLQRAALKRLHRRWDGSLQAQRFLQERRILAALSHPNIPRLLDHGLDAESRPWFALEYVDGGNLVDWADAHRLGLHARIELFRAVCAAVQHAHEHFVVHRDLKPANILVDEEGHPKVLDFGVAKRIDDTPGTTRTGVFAGFTPEYAAPEQITGGTISAATDVYALGVILYQLLAGQLPYRIDQDDLRAAAETITSRTADRMDKALITGHVEDVRARIAQRDTSPTAFRRFVRGDLTRIVQTALAKEPPRRYASVAAFSTDLRQFLEGRTVSVGGDTFAYHASKFVRRNRVATAVVAVFALALAGSAFYAFQRAHAEHQQRERAETTLAFMRDIFAANAPENTDGAKLTAMQLLDRAGERIDGYFPNDPIAKAQLLGELGDVYQNLTLHDKSIPHLDRAVALLRAAHADHGELYAGRIEALGSAYLETYQYDRALRLVDRERPRLRGVVLHGEPADAILLSQRAWALSEIGRTEEAERDLHTAISLYEQAAATGTASYALLYNNLGHLQLGTGRPREALANFQKSYTLVRQSPDANKLQRLVSRFNVGLAYSRLGDYAHAIPILEEVVPQQEKLVGFASNRTMIARSQLAQAYSGNGEYDRALAVIERNLQAVAASGIQNPRDRIEIGLVKAKILNYALRSAEAAPLAREAANYLRDHPMEPSFERGRMQWIIGETWLQNGDCASAKPALEIALSDALATSDNPANANAAEALDSLGRCHLLTHDLAAARDHFERAIAAMTTALGAEHPRTLRCKLHLAWARMLVAPDPAVLQTMRVDRDALVRAIGSENKPVIWQADLLIDSLARDAGASSGIITARLAQARAGLITLGGGDQLPRYTGLNSFS